MVRIHVDNQIPEKNGGEEVVLTELAQRKPRMRFRPSSTLPRLSGRAACFPVDCQFVARHAPTLHFDYGSGRPPSANRSTNSWYSVPLISPEQFSVSTNSGNTQAAKVLACHRQTTAHFSPPPANSRSSVKAGCKMLLITPSPSENTEKELKAGKTLAHQLDAIMVQGSGSGSIEVEGVLADGLPAVTVVRMRFNNHGRISQVTICLHDLVLTDENLQLKKTKIVARVNLLVFRQKAG